MGRSVVLLLLAAFVSGSVATHCSGHSTCYLRDMPRYLLPEQAIVDSEKLFSVLRLNKLALIAFSYGPDDDALNANNPFIWNVRCDGSPEMLALCEGSKFSIRSYPTYVAFPGRTRPELFRTTDDFPTAQVRFHELLDRQRAGEGNPAWYRNEQRQQQQQQEKTQPPPMQPPPSPSAGQNDFVHVSAVKRGEEWKSWRGKYAGPSATVAILFMAQCGPLCSDSETMIRELLPRITFPVARVDCNVDFNTICREFHVRSFPQLHLFPLGLDERHNIVKLMNKDDVLPSMNNILQSVGKLLIPASASGHEQIKEKVEERAEPKKVEEPKSKPRALLEGPYLGGLEKIPLDPHGKITLIHGFLGPEDCEEIVRFAQAPQSGMRQSTVVNNDRYEIKQHRNSSTLMITPPMVADIQHTTEKDPRLPVRIFRDIRRKAEELSGLPREHLEHLMVVRYLPSEHYGIHHDAFGLHQTQELKTRGGDRKYTILLYLNDVPENAGGATVFPKLGNLHVRPKKGSVVFWRNIDDKGNQLGDMVHLAEMLRGENTVKWAMNIWVRQRKYPFSFDDKDTERKKESAKEEL